MTKTCRRCGEAKSHDEFHRDRKSADGLMGVCVPCNKARVVEWRKRKRKERDRNRASVAKYREAHRDEINAKNREKYRADLEASRAKERERWHRRAEAGKVKKKDPRKVKARKMLERALKAGTITRPDHCQGPNCEGLDSPLEAHHRDYDKPLDVLWLCAFCHRATHQDSL